MTMTQNTDFKLPFNSLTNYIPQHLKNDVNTSLFDNLFNRFLTHDESVPLYGYVGRKPSAPDDRSPRVPQSSIERDVNAIVPVLNFKLGADRYAFTVEDLVRKAEAMGISPGNLQWLYSQGNNYLPPINLDKFTNFFNYYWVASVLPTKPEHAWNPTLAPEYYTIAAPLPADKIKLNVVAASTEQTVLAGSGFTKLSFKVEFTTPTTFTITPIGSLGAYTAARTSYELSGPETHIDYLVRNGQKTVKLVEFEVTREMLYDEFGEEIGTATFEAGDTFTINTEFLSRNYTVSFVGSNGIKGKIVRVKPLNAYQTIDGVQLREGDRVLIKNNSILDDGIYVVSAGQWKRAEDFDGETRSEGAMVFVQKGQKNGGKMFTSVGGNGGFGFQLAPEPAGGYQSNTNDWQESNYWVAGEKLADLGLARSDAVQAVRPIIEYTADVQLNSFVQSGVPSDSGTPYRQVKTEFNQLPLFDLFRYDGSHAGKVSSVFYYSEDVTADLDLKLQRRVLMSTNDSADFLFNHGMEDDNDQLLFIKRGGQIKSIWHAGYTEATIGAVKFTGKGTGTLAGLKAEGFTQQQVWTLEAVSETTFTVSTSKIPLIPSPFGIATVGAPYDNGEVMFTIEGNFQVGDTFHFSVGNLETPRYVHRDVDSNIVDFFGGQAADTKGEGAWQIPRTFYNNPYNDSRSPVTEGVLYSHFRGILGNQLSDKVDYSFGGSIKLWSEQQTLLASLLMQRDMTPISMIDLAQRQYETALNNVQDIFQSNIVQFMANHGPVTDYDGLETLLKFVQGVRAQDNDVRTVLYDSTSPLVGFPATLPQLGIAELVKPGVSFERALGRTVLTHHDGHQSLIFENTAELRSSILGNMTSLQIKRSDGTYTGAISFSAEPPTHPFKGELWQAPNGTIFSYNVLGDSDAPPLNPKAGDGWFKRASRELLRWDGSFWQPDPDVLGPWVQINFADTLNSLLLLTETKLYEGINPNIRKYNFEDLKDDAAFNNQVKRELFSFSAVSGYDPLGSDYDATKPFTWNYSSTGLGARWFDVIMNHQATIDGVKQTERPNLEPWKLFGFDNSLEWWSSLPLEKKTAYTPFIHPQDIGEGFVDGGTVSAVQAGGPANTALSGTPIIDGVQLRSGDRVLLQNEQSPANNGVWVVGSTWTRAANSTQNGYVVSVLAGNRKGTVWVLDEGQFKQAREWSDEMWADIKALHPDLKVSVNTYTDELLPPYVNSSSPGAENAITNTRPASAARQYEFGQNSPVETVWKRSLEYRYSLARALFRYDPLAFLGFCWGFNWVEVDGILYDSVDMNMPGHKRFRLHGDAIDIINRSELKVTGTGSAIVTYDAYDVHKEGTDLVRAQNFTVSRNGKVIGYAVNGKETKVGGLTFTIKDEGRPFRIGDRFEIKDGKAIFVPATSHRILGFGQTFTHALRETSIDTKSSYAVAAFREWDVNMGYRAGGLVATDDLHVYTDSTPIPDSAFDLMFKKNQIARNEWLQALRISVVTFGETVKKDNGVAPKGRGEDWVFRVEGYNPRHTAIEYYDMRIDRSASDFHALSKAHTDLVWYEPKSVIKTITTELPLTITGVQNVVDFLFGYKRYLEDRGWEFNKRSEFNIDAETGRTRNFNLEIEKFIDRCYAGLAEGQGHVINPFVDRVWFNQETGLLSEFVDTALFDISGHPGVFDTLGVKFSKDDLHVTRTNTQSSFGATAPMFSVHVQVDDFEHLFIFNNFAQPSTESGLLYDPFSGARVVTYKFKGRKQATNTMRPEFGGHFLVGNKVQQNLQATTDNIANLYDANRAFENEKTTRHALALLGFNHKKYFDDLDISEKTQFNFWRGLVQSKGTNLSIDAYLNNNRFDDAKVDEYWAYKLAEYGDARQRAYPELKLSVNDALTQFTRIQFDNDSLKTEGFDIVNHFDEDRWFSIEDMNQDVKFAAETVGTYTIDAVKGSIYELPFIADALVPGQFTQISATTIRSNVDGELIIVGKGPATPRFSPVKVFNYVENELVAEIPLWHPATGQHTPTAMESINIISNVNPARYNYSKQAVNNNTYDPLRPWGANEVGRVWFDTRNLAYLPYYDKTIFELDERLSRWGTLADYASVDVYEWVQSTVPPNEYDALAAEQAGDAGLNEKTKAAGQVADKQLYTRERSWATRPIAWSYSPIPNDVEWGATPPFVGGSTDARLLLQNGLAILDRGTFAQYGIQAGMRLGAWNNDPVSPKPLSEYIIENKFKKLLLSEDGKELPSTIPVKYEGMDFKVDIAVAASEFSGDVTIKSAVPVTSSVGQDDSFDLLFVNKDGVDRVATPKVANIGGTSGSQIVRFTPGLLPGSLTGLGIADEYTLTIEIDGVETTVKVSGAEVQTVERLLAFLNDQFETQPFDVADDIVLLSPTTGPTSTIKIINGELFSNMTGFDAILPPTDGTGRSMFVSPLGDSLYSPSLVADDVITVKAEKMGVTFAVTPLGDGQYPANVVQQVILRAIGGDDTLEATVQFRDAVVVTPVIASEDVDLSNDPEDKYKMGWRVWAIPTQAQLNADGHPPVSSWKPYIGDYSAIDGNLIEIADAKEPPLVLRNGQVIDRYQTSWSEWIVLKNTVLSYPKNDNTAYEVSRSGDVVTFMNTSNFDAKNTSVYVNGIAQLKASFTLNGKQLAVKGVGASSKVAVIIRRYEPTAAELAFDPAAKDDLTFQRQYVADYEYVALPVRDREGALTSNLYYFWVKNKTTPAMGKKQSVQAVAQQLREGPPAFLTFQNLSDDGAYTYDAITISGLSYIVTKDDAFKLRFTRNFTLRDDPEEFKLKNVHTEWALIRPGQKQRIPENLWRKLTDSVAGQDAAGNAVPAMRRVLYDERHGTRTQFGFGAEQTLAPAQLLRSSIVDAILNTKLMEEGATALVPDYISFLNLDESDEWFATAESSRKTMTDIWNQAKVAQVNEIFFAALNDVLASNYELSDIFKTSRLSAYSIKVIGAVPVAPTFE